MSKKLKVLLVLVIGLILFYKIVVNADSIKHNLSWIFEGNEEEMALPELSNEEIEKAKAQMGDDEQPRPRRAASQPEKEEVLQEEAPASNAVEQNQELQDVVQTPTQDSIEQEAVASEAPEVEEVQNEELPVKKKKRKLIKKITQEPVVEDSILQ